MAFRRNFIFGMAAQLSSKLLSFGVMVWLARSLGPESWGGMQWALAAAGIFGALADFSLGSLAMREIAVARDEDKGAWIMAAWRLKGLMWFLALLMFGLVRSLESKGDSGLLIPAALLTVAMSLAEFNGSLFAGIERMDLDFKLGTLSKLLQAVVALGASAWGAPVGIILTAWACAAWAGWAWGFLALRSHAGRLGKGQGSAHMAVLARGMWPFGLAPVLILIYYRVDTLLLGYFRGDTEVGIYQSAYKWLDSLNFVPGAFIAAAFPGLARTYGRDDALEARLKALKAMGALGALASAFLFALAPLLTWLLGARYDGAQPLLRILCLSCLFLFPNFVLVNLLVALRMQARVLHGCILAVILNVTGNILLIPRFGATASAWLTAATEGVIFAVAVGNLGAQMPWPSLRPWFLRSCAAGLPACLLAYALQGRLAPLALFLAPALALGISVWLGLLPMDEIRSLWIRLRTGEAA